eukprot:3777704-Prorocentrum_lima.AAC.1
MLQNSSRCDSSRPTLGIRLYTMDDHARYSVSSQMLVWKYSMAMSRECSEMRAFHSSNVASR